eukprot:m.6448 g.6448  ORF g.6448 m.6448 type:complete len:174 (+) comp15924_c0_seq1:69-590(+)
MSENSRSEEKSSIKKRAFQFFARAKQYTQEKIGSAEKTQYDVSFENLVLQANRTKEWTEKVVKGIEDILLPDSKFHFKDFFYDKLTVRGNKTVSRPTAATVFGQVLLDAGHDLGPESPFGEVVFSWGSLVVSFSVRFFSFAARRSGEENRCCPCGVYSDGLNSGSFSVEGFFG